ncbi:MAG: lasso RiPP family leader peptide-containing protein [Pseudonocardiales bacterium]|nr:lasso RiPP family leader peptide-containing protein [Pseudonocardiales bacterium]
MDIYPERDTEIRVERPGVYEPPILEEIGEFAVLTRADRRGSAVDGTGYYSE